MPAVIQTLVGRQRLPWQTIGQVNRFTFAPGDSILLKRGDVWREQLTVPLSGKAGKIVTFGAYGVGPKPIIKGSDVVSGWAMERAPYVWKAAVAFRPNQVFRNGQRMRLVPSLRALVADNQWFFDGASSLYIYSDVLPSSAIIEAGNRVSCIRLGNIELRNHRQLGLSPCQRGLRWCCRCLCVEARIKHYAK